MCIQFHRSREGRDVAPFGGVGPITIPIVAQGIDDALRLGGGIGHAKPNSKRIAILRVQAAVAGVIAVRSGTRVPKSRVNLRFECASLVRISSGEGTVTFHLGKRRPIHQRVIEQGVCFDVFPALIATRPIVGACDIEQAVAIDLVGNKGHAKLILWPNARQPRGITCIQIIGIGAEQRPKMVGV